MYLMEKFCFKYSVRLGTIVTIILGFLAVFPITIYWLVQGPDSIRGSTLYFRDNLRNEYSTNSLFDALIQFLVTDIQRFFLFVQIFQAIYLASLALAFYGAYKLQKYFLVPFIILEIFRFICNFSLHVVCVIVLKKKLNLGLLIVLTVLGGFCLLFFSYLICTTIALYQIIGIVKSAEYIKLYGDDPFNPWDDPETENQSIEFISSSVTNVKMYRTPDFDAPLKSDKYPLIDLNKKKYGDLAVIPIDHQNIEQQLSKEYQYWHANEIYGLKKSNIFKFNTFKE